jgi:hypothetical protein
MNLDPTPVQQLVETPAAGGAPAAPAGVRSGWHPSMGHVDEARVTALDLRTYQVSIGDRVIGFLREAGAQWNVLTGSALSTATESTATYPRLMSALRALTH